VAGRVRTAAPRDSGGRSTGLTYGHASGDASLSVHLPGAGGRRSSDTSLGRYHARPAGPRCFPCLSPTLRPWIGGHRCACAGERRPTWRGVGARASFSERQNSRLKRRRMPQRLFQRERRGSFSLRRGLDSSSELLQAEHHLSLSTPCAFETTKATRWVALTVSGYVASFLAHGPLSEDMCIAAQAFRRAGRAPVGRVDSGVGWRWDEE
jgi:hypothetical protein